MCSGKEVSSESFLTCSINTIMSMLMSVHIIIIIVAMYKSLEGEKLATWLHNLKTNI